MELSTSIGLSLVKRIMGWTEQQAATEFKWLKMMSAVKFDGYADYRTGVRFAESLATWLKQFKGSDRTTAYNFLKKRLVYISPPEMNQLIESFVPEVVIPQIRSRAGDKLGIPAYQVWSTKEGDNLFQKMLRRTLFVGMSDGSRIDVLRRSNIGRLVTDQVVHSLYIDDAKWLEIGEKLTKDKHGGEGEKFDHVYLIDDFTASGTTFIRFEGDKWKGKLKKFNANIREARKRFESDKELKASFPLQANFTLHIHHHLSSAQAKEALLSELNSEALSSSDTEFGEVCVTEGMLLSATQKLTEANADDKRMLELCDNYYDPQLYYDYEKHCKASGQDHLKYGYAHCKLPIILDHNTPNNSLSILWAKTDGNGDKAHAMRPLFSRRSRHG